MKYLLISVVDREISLTVYRNEENAIAKMEIDFIEAKGPEAVDDNMAECTNNSAWITEGLNHDDYDWWIVPYAGKEQYLLTSIVERHLAIEYFSSFSEAKDEMLKQFYNFMRSDEQLSDGSAMEGNDIAYVTDGINHDDYDWKIFTI